MLLALPISPIGMRSGSVVGTFPPQSLHTTLLLCSALFASFPLAYTRLFSFSALVPRLLAAHCLFNSRVSPLGNVLQWIN
ncbi:hypothetical protein BCV70DRAFT_104294 [Testicularia cyperi]|uniref:Uncharacterized protein n=1 Tax=Testicularia cyperi TaxID=1882483 RepID=A0A317XRW5_9BASI|nr:hypothetical protein BCV70DRAFT_104294 [Testicularia cyperi]